MLRQKLKPFHDPSIHSVHFRDCSLLIWHLTASGTPVQFEGTQQGLKWFQMDIMPCKKVTLRSSRWPTHQLINHIISILLFFSVTVAGHTIIGRINWQSEQYSCYPLHPGYTQLNSVHTVVPRAQPSSKGLKSEIPIFRKSFGKSLRVIFFASCGWAYTRCPSFFGKKLDKLLAAIFTDSSLRFPKWKNSPNRQSPQILLVHSFSKTIDLTLTLLSDEFSQGDSVLCWGRSGLSDCWFDISWPVAYCSSSDHAVVNLLVFATILVLPLVKVSRLKLQQVGVTVVLPSYARHWHKWGYISTGIASC